MPGAHGSGCGCDSSPKLLGGTFLTPKALILDGCDIMNCENPADLSALLSKSYEDRLNDLPSVRSDKNDDNEVLIRLAFSSPCKVASLILIGGDSGKSPSKLTIYAGHEHMDFSDVSQFTPIQELFLKQDFHGVLEYPLRTTQLHNCQVLHLYFQDTIDEDADCLEIHYLGLRGEISGARRDVVQTVYESRAMREDHQVAGDRANDYSIQ
eukprot:GHVH01004607.1.p1 GENE.GHVH01004607.1~~GHVH01004607.1.p1  ORF type:complete len:210 (+),score=15.60 GHVH01004607.1:71-700(+)